MSAKSSSPTGSGVSSRPFAPGTHWGPTTRPGFSRGSRTRPGSQSRTRVDRGDGGWSSLPQRSCWSSARSGCSAAEARPSKESRRPSLRWRSRHRRRRSTCRSSHLAIKVSPSALAWRSPTPENPLLADLKPAFDAFRAADYQRADREFSALSKKYPTSIEIWFHQGVARLLANDVPGATASLATAGRLADSSFAGDVAWYRAVADERAGDLASARARLTGLCGQPGARAKPACEALKQLPPR